MIIKANEEVELCDWFEQFESKKNDLNFTEGVYNLTDLREWGR